jgi:hypothetical protein
MAKKAKKDADQTETGGDVPEIVSDGVSEVVPDTVLATEEKTPQEMSDLKQKHYDAICSLNLKVQQARIVYEDVKAEAASEKLRYESLQEQLNSLISQGANPQRELAFPEHAADEQNPETWKDVPISEVIVLTPKQIEKLEAAGVKTMGQFEHLRSGQMDGFPDGLNSVKGVGQKTVDEWEEQALKWLFVNNREPEKEGTDDAGAEQEEG